MFMSLSIIWYSFCGVLLYEFHFKMWNKNWFKQFLKSQNVKRNVFFGSLQQSKYYRPVFHLLLEWIIMKQNFFKDMLKYLISMLFVFLFYYMTHFDSIKYFWWKYWLLFKAGFSFHVALEFPVWSSGWFHSCREPLPRPGPLPSTPLPLQTRSPTQFCVQPLCSAQRSSHTEKKKFKSTQRRGGGRETGGENALETWLIKKLKNSDRILTDCKVVTGKSAFLGLRRRRGGRFSRMLKLVWDFLGAKTAHR